MLSEVELSSITYFSKIATTFCAIIPIAVASATFNKAERADKVFALFILFSFTSDLLGFLIFLHQPEWDGIKNLKYAIYSLFDALLPMIFLWLINKKKSPFQKLIGFTFILLLLLWGFEYLFRNPIFESSKMFDFSYCILNAFFAAYSLLILAERTEVLTKRHDFWFLTGIFFYFFCANFMMALIETKVGQELWGLHNIIAIIGYTIFTIGFIKLYKNLRHKQVITSTTN